MTAKLTLLNESLIVATDLARATHFDILRLTVAHGADRFSQLEMWPEPEERRFGYAITPITWDQICRGRIR